MKSLLFLVSLLLAVSVSVSLAAEATTGDSRRELIDGGWQPIKDLKDPHVEEIAEFAIDEYNKGARSTLKLLRVTSGETQIVDGINYRLVFFAAYGGFSVHLGKFEATVLVKSEGDQKELTSFKRLRV